MFFEAVLYCGDSPEETIWQDRSTPEYFIFESPRGFVRLRKRASYPQTAAYVSNGILEVGYGNVQQGRQIARLPLADIDEQAFCAEEFLYVQFDLHKAEVVVQRDALSTLPVFVGYQNDRVIMSSEHSRVIELLDKDQLQVDSMALLRYVCGLDYTYNTLFKDVVVPHDRMRFVWSNGRAQLEVAPHAAVLESIQRRDGSIRQLQPMLESILTMYSQRYVIGNAIACEWSGGHDSALIAGYLSDQGYEVATACMLLPGPDRSSQLRKHHDFSQRFRITNNIAVPLEPSRHYRFQEAYESGSWKPADFREMTALGVPQSVYLSALQAQGFSSIFTGIGGDELCEENDNPHKRLGGGLSDPFAWHDHVPPVWWTPEMQAYLEATATTAAQQIQQTMPPMSPSVTSQGFRGNGLYIRHGIWPVHPLGDSKLYAYCQSLPLRYRVNKHLIKMYLEARRTPHSIYRGQNEDFRDFYYTSAVLNTRPILEMFMPNSLLARAGLVHKNTVMALHDQVVRRPFSRTNWRTLFDIVRLLNVETVLQTSGLRSLDG